MLLDERKSTDYFRGRERENLCSAQRVGVVNLSEEIMLDERMRRKI
jgi:hypothetical protein